MPAVEAQSAIPKTLCNNRNAEATEGGEALVVDRYGRQGKG
jgi:hypothetical protein